MDVRDWGQILFRWIHVVAGIMWIGHLWFFNFVNAQVAKTYDADSKKKVIPELMPRALYWFRWGAAYTFITGLLLLGMVYYMGGETSGMLVPTENAKLSVGAATGAGLGLLVVAFLIYDVMWKSFAKNETVGAIVSFALVTGVAYVLANVLRFSGRAVFIHVGAMFGTIMAANVWMRIWPNQRRIITATKEGRAPDAAWGALAGLRSKHNTYMSVPLVLMMVSQHWSTALQNDFNWAIIAGAVALGWGMTKLMYNKSGSDAPKQYAIELPPAAPAPEKKAEEAKK